MQITKVTWTSPSFSSLGINSCACIENTLQDQYIVSPFLSIRNSASVTQAGCWLLDSLIKTADTGWMTKETGGMTVWLHLEPQLILQLTLTWSHPGFGWLKAQSSRSRVVMTPVSHASSRNHRELFAWADLSIQNHKLWQLQKWQGLVQWQVPGKLQGSIWRRVQENTGFWTSWVW